MVTTPEFHEGTKKANLNKEANLKTLRSQKTAPLSTSTCRCCPGRGWVPSILDKANFQSSHFPNYYLVCINKTKSSQSAMGCFPPKISIFTKLTCNFLGTFPIKLKITKTYEWYWFFGGLLGCYLTPFRYHPTYLFPPPTFLSVSEAICY